MNIDKGHATAAFVSANAEVRDALESALPRLREMFASAGIALGQTSVSAESFSQQAGDGAKRRFLEFWTRKESVLKASGTGIMDDLHSLRVDQPRNDLTIRHPEFVAMAAPAYHVHTWHVGACHLVSAASPEEIREVSAWSAGGA